LLTASALGLMICLIGGTGLFAALTDSAHTGTNSIDSTALAPSADVQLATASTGPNGYACGTFTDDLATGLLNYSNMPFGFGIGAALCIRNVGSQPVSLTAAIDQLTDIDLDCTGDEAVYDASCGNNDLGELSSALDITISNDDCATGNRNTLFQPGTLATFAGAPQSIGSLGPGDMTCIGIGVSTNAFMDTTLKQKAQTDQTTWRFVFTGQA